MAWYYGVNNSNLYGSNFSTVLADAPPPLDDTEEEDNDIVFRNHGKKVNTQVSQSIPPAQKKLNSRSSSDETNFGSNNPQSSDFPLSGQTPVRQDTENQGHLDAESDFGDFTGFADFDSAFGGGNGEETSNMTWFNSEENDVLPQQADIITNGEPKVSRNQNENYWRETVDCTHDQNNFLNDGSVKDPGVNPPYSKNSKNIGRGHVNSIDNTYEVGLGDTMVDTATKTSNEGTKEGVPSDQTGTQDSKGSVSSKNTVDSTLGEDSADKWKNDRESEQCNFPEFRGSDKDLVDQDEEINPERTVMNGDSTAVNKNEQCSKDFNTVHKEDRNCKGIAVFCNETNCDPGGVVYSGHETSLGPSRIENAKSSRKQAVDAYCMQGDEENFLENDNRTEGVIHKDECTHSVALSSKEESLKPKQNDFGTTSAVLATNKNDLDASGTREGSESRHEADTAIVSSGHRGPNGQLESTQVNSETKTIADENDPQEESMGEFTDFSGFTDNCTANIHGKQNSNLNRENVVDVTVANLSTVKLEQNNKGSYCKAPLAESTDGDFSSFDSRLEKLPEEGQMDDSFGEFGAFSSEPDDLTRTGSNNGEFGEFGTFTSQSKVSLNEYDRKDNLEDPRSSGSQLTSISKNLAANDPKLCSSPDGNDDDGFGDFSAFDSKTEDLSEKKKQSDEFGDFDAFVSKTEDLSEKDMQSDSFGDFGSFDSKTKDSSKKDEDPEAFGDFGVFDSKTEDLLQKDNQCDEFGDVGSFDSQANASSKANAHEDDFGEFNVFDSQPKSLVVTDLNINPIAESNVEAIQTDDDFGNFGSFESSAKCDEDFGNLKTFLQTQGDTNPNPPDNNFGDFNAFSSSVQSKHFGSGSDEGFGNFSNANISDSNSGFAEFASFPHLKDYEYSASNIDSMKQRESLNGGSNKAVSVSSQEVTDVKLQSQQLKARDEEGTLCIFTPGGNVILTQAGKPVSLCFSMLGTVRVKENSCTHDVLPNIVKNAKRSNSQIWRDLDTPEEEEKTVFSWPSSFSKHKKLISLNMRPDRPPLQVNSLLMPTIMGSGGGLGGSILTPDRTSKLTHFTAGLGLLEPVRGLGEHAPYSVQNKDPSQSSSRPQLALPDLSFVLGAGLKRATSKSDIKDNVSDTTSESSSLDLDFFVPTSSALSAESRSDSRGLYEDDLLGLNIISSSEDFPKTDSPKIQRPPEAKKVWQYGGVTIPLTSQEKTTKLSTAAKRAIGELEDLSFMNSSVLMFPLKSE